MAEGRVILVGAGPGDPGLLTLRGRDALVSADVVIYDRLVHTALLSLCRPDCERICVGKRAGAHSITQDEIEEMLVTHARAGKAVVRLKGGDPLVFGRGGEEAGHLAAAGIACEIVPGVTASVAAGAFGGIPLTHRECASTLVLATGHEDPERGTPQVDWRALGALEQTTICIYMGMARLAHILAELQAGGLAPDVPAACIEWASLGRQRTVAATVSTLAEAIECAGLAAPAIVVVGEVVRYRDTLAWFERRPLLGRRIVVTRNREQAGELSGRLEALGATVLELPLVHVRPDYDRDTCAEVFAEFGSYDWLVFTSGNGVRYFFDLFRKAFDDIRSLGVMRIAAIGEPTARAIREMHLAVEVMPKRAVAEDLAQALIDTGSLDSAKVLVVSPHESRDVLTSMLTDAHAIVDRFPIYRTDKTDLAEDFVARDFRELGADAVLFTSSSGVHSFVDQAAALRLGPDARKPLAGSIGAITSETMRAVGMPVDFEAKTASLDALVEAVVKRLSKS